MVPWRHRRLILYPCSCCVAKRGSKTPLFAPESPQVRIVSTPESGKRATDSPPPRTRVHPWPRIAEFTCYVFICIVVESRALSIREAHPISQSSNCRQVVKLVRFQLPGGPQAEVVGSYTKPENGGSCRARLRGLWLAANGRHALASADFGLWLTEGTRSPPRTSACG